MTHLLEADDDEDDEDEDAVVLWQENKPAFDVFVQCKWQVVITPDGKRVFMGISAVEIQAACWLCRITDSQITSVLNGVRICESTAMPILNRDS